MRYPAVLVIFSLFMSCTERPQSCQTVASKMPSSANSKSVWFPKPSEEQLLINEVGKIKDDILQLIVLDSVEQSLEEIYFRDQIYRDSLQTVPDLDEVDIKRLRRKMINFDEMNSELAINLIGRSKWPNTRHMSKEAQDALCLVTIHSNSEELNQLVSENIDRAFYKDSSFSAIMFAAVSDRLSLRNGGNYIYGTLTFKVENFSEKEINQINRNRSKLGLKEIE